MRKLKSNERLIKEYEKFVLVEVTCENGMKYRTTINKFEPKNTEKVKTEGYRRLNSSF